MYIKRVNAGAGFTLVEMLLVVAFVALMATFGVGMTAEMWQEFKFYQAEAQARVIANSISAQRKLLDLPLVGRVDPVSLATFIEQIGRDQVETYMPELLATDQILDSDPATLFFVSVNEYCVKVSWDITDPKMQDFEIPFAGKQIQVPADDPDPAAPDPQPIVTWTVMSGTANRLALAYQASNMINSE